jgi:acyl-homoserine lactone acylase PvdQ
MRRRILVALCAAPLFAALAAPPSPESLEAAYRANNVGVALLEQFRHDDAAASFRKALELAPGLALARANLAIALLNEPKLEEAREAARAAAAQLPGIPRAGAWQTVNVADHSLRASSANGFMFGSGPARRFVGEMLPTISASEVIPGGNSAVLGSVHYVDQLPLWLSNLYHPLPIPVASAAAAAQSETDFHP